MNSQPYEREAQERWGDTDAYKESARRIKNYTDEDFTLAKKQAEAAVMMFVDAMNAGLLADSLEAAEAAEAHRLAISDWYYECSYDMQAGLAAMYLADSRFTEHYENYQVGLAQYVHDAILANAINKS